jgi:type II secretory pathway pseudopilin PulG
MTIPGILRSILKSITYPGPGQKGLGLVETLAAVAILGTSVVAFVTALSAGTLAANEQDEEVIVQSLAQTQLEYTKSYAYDSGASSYPAVTAPEGYAVSVEVASVPGADSDIQKITLTISRESETVFTVEDYKVNR